MLRSIRGLVVGSVILVVALQGERTLHGEDDSVLVANEPHGEPTLAPAQAAEARGEELDPEKLRADFRIARQALEEGHSGLYRYTSKEELDRVFDQAEKSLTKPMSMLAFYRVLVPVVAAIKCGHTEAALPADFMKAYEAKKEFLPLEVRMLGGGIYVWRDLSGSSASLAGMEIRAVNGVSAPKLVDAMLAATSGDGDIQTSRMKRIGRWWFSSQLVVLVGLSGPYDVVLWNPKEKWEFKVRLEGKDMARLQEQARARFPKDYPPGAAAEFALLDGGKVALMKIPTFGEFVDADRKKTMEDFYRESFEAMSTNGTKTLVLDLRDNGGGEDVLGKLLLSYLLDKPFKYYDELVINAREFTFGKYAELPKVSEDAVEHRPDGRYRVVNHPNVGIQQPSKPTFEGKVLILINGGCYSTTAEFLSQAHHHRRATFIGEESGGGYYGNTSGVAPGVTLPNSKLVVYVPLVTYYMAVSGHKAAAHGIVPDHSIRYTIDELLAGTDKELAVALALARK